MIIELIGTFLSSILAWGIEHQRQLKRFVFVIACFVVIGYGFRRYQEYYEGGAPYYITDYRVDMDLYSNGSMKVKEKIKVHFSQERHGLIRNLSLKNPKTGRVTSISNPQVLNAPFSVSNQGGYLAIKIGDPNIVVKGDHYYDIEYLVDNAIVSFNNGSREELYRNVIGTDRDASIDKVNFSIRLPKDYVSNGDHFYAVYGKAGDKKQKNLIFKQGGASLFVGSLSTRLGKQQGLTIYLPFARDFFSLGEQYGTYFAEAVESVRGEIRGGVISSFEEHNRDRREWFDLGKIAASFNNGVSSFEEHNRDLRECFDLGKSATSFNNGVSSLEEHNRDRRECFDLGKIATSFNNGVSSLLHSEWLEGGYRGFIRVIEGFVRVIEVFVKFALLVVFVWVISAFLFVMDRIFRGVRWVGKLIGKYIGKFIIDKNSVSVGSRVSLSESLSSCGAIDGRTLDLIRSFDGKRYYNVQALLNKGVHLLTYSWVLLFLIPFMVYMNDDLGGSIKLVALGWIGIVILFGLCYFSFDLYVTQIPKIPYYTPPKQIDPLILFAFAMEHGLGDKSLAPLLYYLAGQKLLKIRYDKADDQFIITENVSLSQIKTDIYARLLSSLFSEKKTIRIGYAYDPELALLFDQVLKEMAVAYGDFAEASGWFDYKILFNFFYYSVFSEKGKVIFDHLDGFKLYLHKVEQQQIEMFLREDPEYIDKLLPWLVLFGLQNKLSEGISELISEKMQVVIDDNFKIENFTLLSSLTTALHASTQAPVYTERESSGGGSDFGSGGGESGSSFSGSSGGGGGGGGGTSR